MANIDPQKIQEALTRGVEKIIVKDDLEKKLLAGKKLRLYLGVDPTGFSLHLGHAVVLRKLKEFVELGHEVILLIGDFTAKIGDPTGKDAARIPLSDKQIKENFKDYKKQASKILNFSKVKIKYNSAWLSKLRFADILELSSHFTVQQMLHREMFDKRLKENAPINQTEFMYPLMQGYDSVAMDVDLEVGGNDQMFNMLVGRDLQKIYNHKEKDVLTTKLLLGTDGRKMSKTYGNAIYLNDAPEDMFGKIMSIKDELIAEYFDLATELPSQEIAEILKIQNPRDQKAKLAHEIVKMYHGEALARKAEEEFNNTFRDNKPAFIEYTTKEDSYPKLVNDILVNVSGAVSSVNAAKTLITQGAVEIDGSIEKDWNKTIELKEEGSEIRIGKRTFAKVKLKK
ncbi:MAG: tyrosine--tRNA ligase [bacterium]|nr:tyrosine--tRNA ligase [bacterium]